MTALFSQRNDVTLAGGMDGVIRGAEQVMKNIEVAATQFRKRRISFKILAKYATDDLGFLLEVERYEAKLFEGKEKGVSINGVQQSFGAEKESGEPFIGAVTHSPPSGQ